MKIVKLFPPLTGEHILHSSPALRRTVETGWQRRLNLYTGRSLSDRALTLEQRARAGRLTTYGQRVSTGVVAGLEVGLEASAPDYFLHLAPGFGVTASGEDVVVPAGLRVDVFDLPVLGPAPTQPRGDALPPHVMLSGRLNTLLSQGVAPVGILVLQPIEVEAIGDFNAADQCELDPASYAYEDWLLVDGVRLLYYAWPTASLELPAPDARWRNRLAYAVFEEERNRDANEGMPWEHVGVPIGLLAFESVAVDAEEPLWRPIFVDRSSVVRAGGKPKRRKQFVGGAGNPFLWQARLQQFAEQLTSMPQPNQMRSQLEKLPPAGLLPRDALTINFDSATSDPALSSSYFPTAFQLQVLPAPLEQLDVVLEASAPLAPLNLNEAEVVQLLVPIPQALYDPDLLQREKEAPQFATEIATLTTNQNKVLARQKDVEGKGKLIGRYMRGEKNPVALEFQRESEEEDFGTKLNTDGKTRSVEAIDALKTTLLGRGKFLEAELPVLEKDGLETLIRQLEEKANQADDRIDFGFLNIHTDLYRLRQHVLGTALASRLAVFPSVAQIAEDESTVARYEKINEYAQKIKGERSGLIVEPASIEAALPNVPEPRTTLLGGMMDTAKFTVRGLQKEITLKDTGIKDFGIKRGTDIQLESATRKVQEESAGTTQLQQSFEKNVASVGWQAVLPSTYQDPHRTTSVGERIKLPEAQTSQEVAYAKMGGVLETLDELKINVDEIALPGVLVKSGQGEDRQVSNYKEYLANKNTAKLKEPAKLEDEADYFASAVRLLDNSIGIWRGVERQVQVYRLAIQDCKNTLAELLVLEGRIVQRLAVLATELAEVQHDLAVATALLEEERARVAAINDYRKDIVENYVDFIAYHRPRTTDLLLTAPTRPLEPGVSEAPVLACINRQLTPPDDLRTMIDLLREVPLQWTPRFRSLFAELNQFDVLHKAVLGAQLRAQVQLQTTNAITTKQVSSGYYHQSIAKVVTAQQTVSQQQRQQLASLNTTLLPQTNWQGMHTLALQHLSIGDLIDGSHGYSKVSHLAAQVLDEIANVAACLHEAFSQVLPEIRLDWAERISQFDAPINLRNLSSLPRWGEKRNGEDLIPFVERRAMQMHVDWLYQQIDPLEDEATALMHEIIRVCILLASHAPVNQIVQGHVHQPTTVSHGSKVELTVDTSKIRVGMHVLMQSADNVMIRAVVDDLSFEKAAATVVQIHTTQEIKPTVRVDEKTIVQFAHTQSFDKMAVKMYSSVTR